MHGFMMVRPEGIEPPFSVPKTGVLSVELRAHGFEYAENIRHGQSLFREFNFKV